MNKSEYYNVYVPENRDSDKLPLITEKAFRCEMCGSGVHIFGVNACNVTGHDKTVMRGRKCARIRFYIACKKCSWLSVRRIAVADTVSETKVKEILNSHYRIGTPHVTTPNSK